MEAYKKLAIEASLTMINKEIKLSEKSEERIVSVLEDYAETKCVDSTLKKFPMSEIAQEIMKKAIKFYNEFNESN